jgi:hypothetical protein
MRQTQASTPNQLFRSSVTTSEKARLPGIPLMIEGLRAKGTLMRQHRRFIQDADVYSGVDVVHLQLLLGV